jgi:hypothetical protein
MNYWFPYNVPYSDNLASAMDFRIIQLRRTAPRKTPSKRAHRLGRLAVLLCGLQGRRQTPITGTDLSRADHGSSTQRLGIRLNERVRAVFRHRWLKEVK